MGIVFDQSLNTTDDVRFTGISLRDGTSASDISIYKTYTSDSDYERLDVKWDSGVPVIGVAVGSGGGNYPNWIQIENESSKFLVKHNGFEFQDATTLLQLNPTNIKVFKDFYPNNGGETSFGTSSNRWLHTYSVNGSFSGDLVTEAGGTQYIYNSYTDASNYERLELKWDTNEAQIVTTEGGTGQFRGVYAGILDGSTKRQGFLMDSTLVSSYWSLGSQCYIFSSTNFRPNGDRMLGNSSSRWSNTYTDSITIGNGVDAVLTADAADTLALRNGTNAQSFNLYNTYTDASNYERLEVKFDSNVAKIESTAAGTGTPRNLQIGNSSHYLLMEPVSAKWELYTSGVRRLRVLNSGASFSVDAKPSTDSTYDLGATSLRWANTYTDSVTVTTDVDIEDGGTRSDPAIKLGGFAQTGIYAPAIYQVGITVAQRGLKIGTTTANVGASSNIGWRSAENQDTGLIDTTMYRDEAYAIGVRNVYDNSSNAFRIYNTYTDASNYERLEIKWDTNIAKIGTTSAGTGSATQLRIESDTNVSVFIAGVRNIDFTGTANRFWRQAYPIGDGSLDLGLTTLRWRNTYTDTITIGDGVDAVLTADAADTLALRNGTNAQAFNIYNTYTDASNYERLEVKWDSNDAFIGAAKAGTGSSRTVSIGRDGVASLKCSGSGGTRSRSIYPDAASTYSLGIDNLRWMVVKTDSITIGDGTGTYGSVLTDDADNVLALRKGTDPQAFNVYNTYTDASNYERLEIKWDTNRATIGPDAAGTGTQRQLRLTADAGDSQRTCIDLNASTSALSFRVSSSTAYTLNSSKFGPEGLASRTLGNTTDRWATTYTKGIATDVETFTATSDTLDAKNNVALCDCTSNAITINLPAASTATGLQFYITKVDSTANTVTIDPDSSETIDGSATKVLSSQYESVKVVSDGTNWYSVVSPSSSSGSSIDGSGTAGSLAVWADSDTIGTGLLSESSNILTQKNSTNPQAYHLYNTDDGAGNNERLELKYVANEAIINTEANGTGTVRALFLATNGNKRWELTTSGGLRPAANVTYSLGTSSNNINQVLTKDLSLGTSASDRSILTSDAADTLALRNGATHQTMHIYGTYTDASNYERLSFEEYGTGDFFIHTESAGTGVNRNLYLGYGPNRNILLSSSSTRLYTELRPQDDSLRNLGVTTARWLNTYTDSITIGDGVDAILTADADDVLALKNSTNGQEFRIYSSDDGAGNDEYLSLGVGAATNFLIETKQNGTGALRQLWFDASQYRMYESGTLLWIGESNEMRMYGTIRGSADSTRDLGTNTVKFRDTYTDNIRLGDGGINCVLTADADDELALRNGTNAQQLNIYSTYTDALNYERLEIGFDGSDYRVKAGSAGTGSDRDVYVGTSEGTTRYRSSGSRIDWSLNGGSSTKMYLNSTGLTVFGEVSPNSDGSRDLGTTALRWANTYTDSITIGDGVDAILTADAADTLALKNSTNSQEFRVYLSDDGAGNSNYLRSFYNVSWGGFALNTGRAGSATSKGLFLGADGNLGLGVSTVSLNTYLPLRPNADGTQDIGTSGQRFGNTFTDSITIGDGVDAILTADADDELALRNGTNAQTQRIYRSYTDASNNEGMEFLSDTFNRINSFANGTGTLGSIEIQVGGSRRFRGDNSFAYIQGQSGGYIFYGSNALKPQSANSIDLGGTSNRWTNTYSVDGDFSGDLTVSGAEGKLVLSGQSSAFETAAGAVSTIYQSDDDGGSYPFTSVGNLILQSRQNASRDIVFATGTTPNVRMVIAGSNGNVGIGINVPTSPLHVVGNIHNTGTITTDGGFADLLAVSGTSAPEVRINNTDSVIFDADEFGRLQWYMNDANTNGTGPAAHISAIFNDNTSGGPAQQTAGEGTDLVFSTGLVLVTGQTQTVTEKLRIDKNGIFKHVVGAESHWYNLDTDASNYERLEVKWDTDVATIQPTAAGTGTVRSLEMKSGGSYVQVKSDRVRLARNATDGVIVESANFRPYSDNDQDLGVSGFRWKTTYTDSITIGDGVDAVLTADAADELALRNGTNAQSFAVYNTYTDASNHERLEVKWDTNIAKISTAAVGTGTRRTLELEAESQVDSPTASRIMGFAYNGSEKMRFTYNSLEPKQVGVKLGSITSGQRWAITHTKGLTTDVETFTAASDTLNDQNNVALCDCTSNNITINLPAASTASGLQYHIKKTDSSSNAVTIDGNGSETIDGATTVTISTQYESITIVSDGSNWHII